MSKPICVPPFVSLNQCVKLLRFSFSYNILYQRSNIYFDRGIFLQEIHSRSTNLGTLNKPRVISKQGTTYRQFNCTSNIKYTPYIISWNSSVITSGKSHTVNKTEIQNLKEKSNPIANIDNNEFYRQPIRHSM